MSVALEEIAASDARVVVLSALIDGPNNPQGRDTSEEVSAIIYCQRRMAILFIGTFYSSTEVIDYELMPITNSK